MTESSPQSGQGGGSRWYQVVLLGVVAVAFVGFFIGTREDDYHEFLQNRRAGPEFSEEEQSEASVDVASAPTYRELMGSAYDKNVHARRSVEKYRGSPPVDEELEPGTRMQNRAYDGAPPTVPHPVRDRSPEACFACHSEGVRVGDRTGPPMSHTYLANCIQCHASGDPKLPFPGEGPDSIPSGSRFRGLEPIAQGERWHDGAPPRIPHRTRMRSDCSSCHGKFGRPGPMSHEYRRNCRQCHVESGGPP